MSIRAKTKKRLLILLACMVVVGGLAVTFIAVRVTQANQRIEAAHEEGMAAFEAGDWTAAIQNLRVYIRKNGDDVDAVYKLAVARENLEEPNGAHVRQSIPLYRSVLQLDRGHKEAREHLLNLYRRSNLSTEGLELAEEALKVDPSNFTALKTKAFSQYRLRDFAKAYDTAKRGNELKPDDIELQMLTLLTMRSLELPNNEIIARGTTVLEKDPDNPRLQLVMGLAHMLTNDRAKAAEAYRRAAAADIQDPEFAETLVRQMDGAGLFAESVELLDRLSKKLGDPQLRDSLVHRLFQGGQADEAMARLADFDKVPSDLLGVQLMLLKRQDKADEVKAVRADLDGRARIDPSARAWTYVFDLIDAENAPSPKEAVAVYERAIQADPTNPYIHDMLARVYLQTQEIDQAINEWRAAAQIAPAWAAPYVGLAEVYATRNQPRRAMEMSQGALLRSPRNPGVVLRFIRSMETMIIEGKVSDKKESAGKLLELVEEFQEQSPGEPSTFPTYLRMLVVTGNDAKAKTALADLLQDEEKMKRYSQKNMLELAQVSTDNGWGLSEKVMATMQEQHGDSPMLAFATAIRMAKDDRAAAVKYMQERVEAQPANAVEWQAQWARLLEGVDDPRALSVWKALGERHKDNPNVQQLILKASSVQGDRPFMDLTINRLREATGEDALAWKLARCRYLLSSGDEAAAREVVAMLLPIVGGAPGIAEPHLLLAVGYEQVGNLTGAVEQLSVVRRMQPDNPAVLGQLAKLQLRLNRTDEVELLANQILDHNDSTPSQRREAAGMLAELGQLEKALAIMQSGVAIETGDYLLAQLYLRANQRDKALAELEKLMESNLSLPVVTSYATLQRAIGNEDAAIKTLAHLKQLDLEPGVREVALADYHEKFGETERAIEYLTEATKSDVTKQAAYRKLITMHIEAQGVDENGQSNGEVKKALELAATAKKAVPGDAVFSLLQSHSALVLRSADRPQMKAILLAIVNSSIYRDSALQTLQMVDVAAEKKTPPAEVIREVRQVADQNPRFRELQHLLSDFYAITGRNDEAAEVASRAMRAFPNDIGSAERAFAAFARLERWTEALAAAKEWRARQASNPTTPDRAIAQAYIGLKQPVDAIKQLEPYRSVALQMPHRFVQWIAIYSNAQVMAGRVSEAEGLLKPLIPQDPTWRRMWIGLAVSSIKDTAVSAAWLDRVAQVIPEDAANEKLFLSDAWLALGRQRKNDKFVDKGMEVLVDLHKADASNADAAIKLGINAQQLGRIDEAEQAYLDLLKVSPDNTVGLNNLAMLYVDQNKSLDKALELAKRVVELRPKVGSFHDTLAEVYLKRKEPAKAVAALKDAVAAEPGSIDWKVNLLAAHLAAGDGDAAKELLRTIDRDRIGRDLSPTTQEKLSQLRQKVAELAAGV